jgi:hypothetical protein
VECAFVASIDTDAITIRPGLTIVFLRYEIDLSTLDSGLIARRILRNLEETDAASITPSTVSEG